MTINGTTLTDLTDYIVTTDLVTLPAYNLFGSAPTLSMMKGYLPGTGAAQPGNPHLARLRRVPSVPVPGRGDLHDCGAVTRKTRRHPRASMMGSHIGSRRRVGRTSA